MDKLAKLNEYRAAQGKKPLKAWKESAAKLDALVASFTKHTTLPRIARELGIDPKTARARLRKKHGKEWRKLSEAELRLAIARQPDGSAHAPHQRPA